jgi:hypothetical protein
MWFLLLLLLIKHSAYLQSPSQKFGKIKKRDSAIFSPDTSSVPSTPRGKNADVAGAPKSTGKRGRKPRNTNDDDDDDDDEETTTPNAKKFQKVKGSMKDDEEQDKSIVKLEEDGDEKYIIASFYGVLVAANKDLDLVTPPDTPLRIMVFDMSLSPDIQTL